MIRIFILLTLFCFIGCSNPSINKEAELLKKRNDLLKRELELEKKSNAKMIEKTVKTKQSREEIVISTLGILSEICESYSFEPNGNIEIDLGTASDGL